MAAGRFSFRGPSQATTSHGGTKIVSRTVEETIHRDKYDEAEHRLVERLMPQFPKALAEGLIATD